MKEKMLMRLERDKHLAKTETLQQELDQKSGENSESKNY
jgi:hypothetical protein